MGNQPLTVPSPSVLRRVNKFRQISWRAGWGAIAIGASVLIGWAFGSDFVVRVIPGSVTQKPNTALGLIASGVTLVLWHWQASQLTVRQRRWLRRWLQIITGFIILLGVLTLVEYGFALNVGIDQLLFNEATIATNPLVGGRAAPNTALNFVFLGLALGGLIRQRYWWAQTGSIAVFLIALLALTGHLYRVTTFYQVGSITGMAIHTAIAFLLLALGVLFAKADQGWIAEVSCDNDGGIMLRRLLPVAILGPIALGLGISLFYENLNQFPEGAIALSSILGIAAATGLLWWNGRLLNRLDAQRALIQHQFNQDLEARAQEQLHQSEDRFRRAIAQAPFPIFIHSEDGKILQMSQTVLEITGYAADEIPTIGDWTERAYGERQMPILEGINHLYDLDRRVDEGEFEVRAKSGAIRTWLFSTAPLGRLNNQARLVISIAADITERKQTEAVLSARLKQQAALAKLSQTALSGLPLEALWEQAAQLTADSLAVEYCQVLGISADERSLRLLANIGWPSDPSGQTYIKTDDDSQAGYTWMTQQPVVCENLETETRFQALPLLIKLGIVSGMSVIIPGQGDRPFGVLAVHSVRQRRFTQEDVIFLQAIANLLATAISRKQIEQELQHLNQTLEQRVQERTQALAAANQELEAFSYSVAHDLRAPLRSIQGFAHVLQEDYGAALDEIGTEYIGRMGASAEQLDTLIQDLLTYSRLGRAEIHLQPVNLAAIVQEILVDLEPFFSAKSASVEVSSPLPLVVAHPSMLQQVLANLISNALKFVAPDVQPQIQIWAEACDRPDPNGSNSSPRVRIWIADNGIGILPQHQQRIFTPFERLHGVDSYPGTGIGLSIVARGIQRMGGEFGVESALHQGSQFWVELAAALVEG